MEGMKEISFYLQFSTLSQCTVSLYCQICSRDKIILDIRLIFIIMNCTRINSKSCRHFFLLSRGIVFYSSHYFAYIYNASIKYFRNFILFYFQQYDEKISSNSSLYFCKIIIHIPSDLLFPHF